jgi:hypothetical protein
LPDRAHKWLLLAASLRGSDAGTARVKLWRTLKELGAASLRDGVTLIPESSGNHGRLAEIVASIESDAGTAWLFEIPGQTRATDSRLEALFDRAQMYDELNQAFTKLRAEIPTLNEGASRRRLRQIERSFDAIVAIDFFAGPAQKRARDRLEKLRTAVNQRFSPEEPVASDGPIARRRRKAFRRQRWATRKGLWVDRAASAWLIRRFIDAHARFLWLEKPSECPPEAHGFDFDGATFTHVGDLVTFEVLLASFDLDDDPALIRIGALVHHLDVGGEPVAEAAGFEAVLSGLRESAPDDDRLLAGITPVLDALYEHFARTGG